MVAENGVRARRLQWGRSTPLERRIGMRRSGGRRDFRFAVRWGGRLW